MAGTGDDGQDVQAGADVEETTEQATGQPETLTLADVRLLLEEQARRFQSQMDKREAGLVRRLQRQEQVKGIAAKHGIKDEALTELQGALKEDDAPADEPLAKPDRQSDAGPNDEQVNAAAQRLYGKYGLTADDPEIEMIDTSGSADDFIESIIHAGRTRQARLKGDTLQLRRTPARTPGLTPAGGRAVETAFGKSKSDLLEAETDAMFRK